MSQPHRCPPPLSQMIMNGMIRHKKGVTSPKTSISKEVLILWYGEICEACILIHLSISQRTFPSAYKEDEVKVPITDGKTVLRHTTFAITSKVTIFCCYWTCINVCSIYGSACPSEEGKELRVTADVVRSWTISGGELDVAVIELQRHNDRENLFEVSATCCQ